MTDRHIANGLITPEEQSTAALCLELGRRYGADSMRVSLNKSTLDSCTLLNGQIDKVMHSSDRSIYVYIFADGRYGTFSTNRLDAGSLGSFIKKAVDTVKMLAPDRDRMLPSPERTAKDAITGTETGLYDPAYHGITAEDRLEILQGGSVYGRKEDSGLYSVISEECEYSDSVDDNYLIDSQGFAGRHTETSFAFCSEITIEDNDGHKYSGYWWESSSAKRMTDYKECSETALERAARQIGPRKIKGGKYNMIVDRSISTRLVSPILAALSGSAIQQKNSFLDGSLGKKVFPENLSITDMARTTGAAGARLYDTEGVATENAPIIDRGTVSRYFIDTYNARKLEMAPTSEGVSRPVLMPFLGKDDCTSEEKTVSLQDIFALCKEGVYVTGFNGGNCNPTTGDFSYGVEGFAFKDGKITFPVREMVITGNMLTLWNSIAAAGTDARKCTRWQIPSLAFADVDFSA